VAPRLGFAYEISHKHEWETVLRAGGGLFFDLVSSEAGNVLAELSQNPPFGNFRILIAPSFPFSPSESGPVSIPSTGSLSNFAAFNPKLRLPYTSEWNVAVEQSLGKDQTISTSYVGAHGVRLLQTTQFSAPPANPSIGFGDVVDNTAYSHYDALQLQFRRRLAHGLQCLASYTWAHSIDNGSAGSSSLNSNLAIAGDARANRGDSDFDIRSAFTAGVTYDLPTVRLRGPLGTLLKGWSTENFIFVRSAPPVDVADLNFSIIGGNVVDVRPDLIAGQPLYLLGSKFPGSRSINPGAFTDPPVDPTTGNPVRQGDVPRNFLRAFGATQWDFALHREFSIRDLAKVQFRSEMFNVLNHPNFGPPNSQFGGADFGVSTQLLGQSLAGRTLGSGGFNPLYQIGGPRSIQLALKVSF